MSFFYLGAILFSFLGMVLLDRHEKLAFYSDAKRTLLTLLVGVVVFIIWDIFGIVFGVFFSGESPYMTGWYLAPEFPIEEFFFLTFLCYFTLMMYRLLEKRWRRI